MFGILQLKSVFYITVASILITIFTACWEGESDPPNNEETPQGETFIQETGETIHYEIIDGLALFEDGTVLGDPYIIDEEGVPLSVLDPKENDEATREEDYEEDLDHTQRITRGRVDLGHPAVGKVGGICTGTLIGARTVLTAAHCVSHGSTVRFEVGGEYYYGTANSHPDYQKGNNATFASDLAIVSLDRPVSGIAPMPLCDTSPNLRTLPITVVGFGNSNPTTSDYGTKRWARNKITSSGGTAIASRTWGAQICFGDSGGPALIDPTYTAPECVIGVAALTFGNCTRGMAHARPDGKSGWIDGAVGDDHSVQWVTPCERKCSEDDETGLHCILACEWGKCYESELGEECGWTW